MLTLRRLLFNNLDMTKNKIKKINELVKIRQQLRKQGKKVVTTNGSYDIFHVGHVRSLEESKAQGDILIVGVNSDSSVKKYKSKERPIVPEKLRAELVASLACVDYVFIFSEINPIKFIKKLKPDVHTNSVDYGENCVEKETVEKNGGKIYLLKKYSDISSSVIIKKILAMNRK